MAKVKKEKSQYIDTGTAIQLILQLSGRNVSKPTLIKWVKEKELGHQCPFGSRRWFIDKAKLTKQMQIR